ncbi:MAG: RNA polymerase sigma factor [Clostridia bacterium]|nr:RNA polymerase sigma factor [Clostridia bacterium]
MQKREVGKLIVMVSNGDNNAFQDLYLQTKRGLFAFLYTYFHNREQTEDAVHNVYLKIKINAGAFKEDTNGVAWILQIAKNYALNELKKSERTTPIEEWHKSIDNGDRGSVTDAMERVLSEEEQRIVTLHVLWGYKHREIASLIGKPLGTITSQYKRAMEKLRKALKED